LTDKTVYRLWKEGLLSFDALLHTILIILNVLRLTANKHTMKITNGKHNIKHSKQKNGFQLLNISTVGFTLGDRVFKGTAPPTI